MVVVYKVNEMIIREKREIRSNTNIYSVYIKNYTTFKDDFSNYFKFNDTIEINNQEYKLIDMEMIFKQSYDFGKDIYNMYNSNKDENDFIDYFNSNKDEIFKLYFEWINNHCYPYIFNIKDDQLKYAYNFSEQCYMLYILYEIQKCIIKYKSTGVISMITLLKYFLLIENVANYSLNNLDNIFSNREEILNDINKILNDSANNTIEQKKKLKMIIPKIREIMINYVISTMNSNNSFIIEKKLPIYNTKDDELYLYYVSNSIMGACYYMLLLKLTSNKLPLNYEICHNPNCTNIFQKYRNRKYCDDCQNYGIPDILKNQKYNNGTRKQKKVSQ